MRHRILLLVLLAFFGLASFGQSLRPVAKMVQDRKATGTFDLFTPLKEDPQSSLRKEVANSVSKSSILNIDNAAILRLLSSKPEAIRMSFSAAISGSIELELVKVNVYAPDFNITTDKSDILPPSQLQVHYRGIVKGINNSLAAISVFDHKIMGVISLPDIGNLVLGEITGENPQHQHVLYRDQNLKAKSNFNCGTLDNPEIKYTDQQLFGQPSPFSGPGGSCVRIYVETDFNIFQNQGSVANVNSFISGLFNQTAMLYQNEGIPMILSQIFVWTSASPYNTSSSSAYLASFQALRNTFNGDLGHLVGFYNFGGIAAGFTGLCNSNRDNDQCISGLQTPPYPSIPTYSWNVMVFTHEMGHLLGSRHTHACVWNGNNTAIDGCSGYTEGGCPLPPNPPGGGTIMSYCHFNVGINFLLGFGPQPSSVIRTRVYAATCLNACSPQPAVDLYIKDKPADNGNEPNPDPTGEFWVSQDIWVRNNNDGGTVHQNPRGGFTNYVYVRVRNRGSASSFSMSSVRLRAYWAKASAALSWPTPWNGGVTGCVPPVSMGNSLGSLQIPAIPGNGSTILVFAWNAPQPITYSCFGSDRFHFCLLARIETAAYAPFGMTFPEQTGQLWANVKNNNNIAWKNVSVSNPNGGFGRMANGFNFGFTDPGDEGEGRAMFLVGGEKYAETKLNNAALKFTFEKNREIAGDAILERNFEQVIQDEPEVVDNGAPAEPPKPNQFFDLDNMPYVKINTNHNIWDFAFVDVDLGELFNRWDFGKGEGIQVLDEQAPSGNPWIRLLKADASITNLKLQPSDLYTVTVRIKQFQVADAAATQYDFDVRLIDDSKNTVGAETFLATLGTAVVDNKNSRVSLSRAGSALKANDVKVNSLQKEIQVLTGIADQYEANLYDPAGKLLQKKFFSGNIKMSTGTLPKGVYLVTVLNLRSKEIYKKKVMIQ